MAIIPKHNYIAYRCPECGDIIYGLVGEFALGASLLKLKCSCGKSALDVTFTNDKKIRLSIPCVFCKQNHNFVVSQSIFFGRDIFLLNCPYSNMDIGFIGKKEEIDSAAEKNEAALKKLIDDMGAQTLADIQPEEMSDDEILPDASVYDLIRFVVKELEADGRIDCPCHSSSYDLRYAPGGIQVFCTECGASYIFKCDTPAIAEEYLDVKEVTLS